MSPTVSVGEIDEVLFRELRKIAARLLRKERWNQSLPPTGLVAEAYVKLARGRARAVDQNHLLSLCCRAMQQVLIDRGRVRRGRERLTPRYVAAVMEKRTMNPELEMAARDMLSRLRRKDPLAAETVWMRYGEGFTIREIAARQRRAFWVVKVDADYALTWMSENWGK